MVYYHSGAGYRSGLEKRIQADLTKRGVGFVYEPGPIKYHKEHRYTPDIYLENGIIIEIKGRFLASDRTKHLLIKQQHPELDLRFVFQQPNNTLTKASKTTYGDWCDKHGFLWADSYVPQEWIDEDGYQTLFQPKSK